MPADPSDPAQESAEDRLIARHFRAIATDPGAFGLGDDAGILSPPPGCDVVLKTDPIIAGVHFFPGDPADAVARKALRVNLSDLAAKGAQPAGFLLAIALPAGTSDEWLGQFASALGDDAARYRCPLLGGDTDRTPGPLTVSVTAFGTVPRGSMLRRSGAKVGDWVVVSGTIGDAALGLALRRDAPGWGLSSGERAHLLARYQLPQPRTELADALLEHASGAMDISDGLAGDLGKLCRASGLAAEIDVERIPLSSAARSALRSDPALIEPILTGGDDYEILCTVPPVAFAAFQDAAKARNVAVTAIGRIVAGPDAPRFRNQDGLALTFRRPSFSHF
jgi:thiamine-monophosphate kinase